MVLLELMLLTYCLLRDHGSIKVRHLVSGTVYFARTSEWISSLWPDTVILFPPCSCCRSHFEMWDSVKNALFPATAGSFRLLHMFFLLLVGGKRGCLTCSEKLQPLFESSRHSPRCYTLVLRVLHAGDTALSLKALPLLSEITQIRLPTTKKQPFTVQIWFYMYNTKESCSSTVGEMHEGRCLQLLDWSDAWWS